MLRPKLQLLSLLPRRRSRRVVIAGLVAVAGWAAWWWLAGELAVRWLDQTAQAVRAEGGDIRYAAIALDGFPVRLRATVTDFAVHHRNGGSWRGPKLVVEVPLWRVTAVRYRVTGLQQLTIPVGLNLATVTLEGAEGSARLGGVAGFTEAELSAAGITLAPAGRGPVEQLERLDLAASAPARAPTGPEESGVTVALMLDRLHVGSAVAPTLGTTLESLALTARVHGPLPRLEAAALSGWSAAGGKFTVDTASLRWGPLAIEGSGQLGLDPHLQPAGTITAEITGFGHAIDALVAAGWIKPKHGQTARAALTGLNPHAANETPPARPAARLVLSIHDRFVHLGPFRLMPLPVLIWPTAAAG